MLSDPGPAASKPHKPRGDRSAIRFLSQSLCSQPKADGCSRLPALPAPHAPDEAEVHAQGPVDAGAVDAQEDPVGDTRPARVLGAAVEARLKRRQRDRQVLATALPLRHPPATARRPRPLCPALPTGPAQPPLRPPQRRSEPIGARSERRPRPQGNSPARTVRRTPAAPRYLVGRRCPKPLEEGLDLRLARLRRHDLSFPATPAGTAAGRAQSPPRPR